MALASNSSIRAEIRSSGTNSRRSTTFREQVWPLLTYASRSPSRELADLAGLGPKVGRFEGEMWPGGFLYGPPGAGMRVDGPVSASGFISGPCWAIGCHWGGVRSGPFS